MVEIYPLKFSKRALGTASQEELVFYLLLAQLTNEILILRKQVMLAANGIKEPPAIRDAATAVVHVNLRLLAGRLYEGYLLMQSKEAGTVQKAYADCLDVQAIESRVAIFRYFSSSKNLIQALRRKSAFHFDMDTTLEAVQKMPDDEELTDYISFERGNSLYYSGALLSAGQMTEVIGYSDVGEALTRIHDEVTDIASKFEDYASGYMVAFMERHRGLNRELFANIREELPGCPDIQQATMSYFLDTKSLHEAFAVETS